MVCEELDSGFLYRKTWTSACLLTMQVTSTGSECRWLIPVRVVEGTGKLCMGGRPAGSRDVLPPGR